ncbi:hypothetical protein M9Y10_044490 [Tritrichomonas musculus]|uniref:Uncharacterized protein n=1 Tax=Tritrichomonas musculus TaxID=1915356 RepID=A0ABR2JSG9_9EUKA
MMQDSEQKDPSILRLIKNLREMVINPACSIELKWDNARSDSTDTKFIDFKIRNPKFKYQIKITNINAFSFEYIKQRTEGFSLNKIYKFQDINDANQTNNNLLLKVSFIRENNNHCSPIFSLTNNFDTKKISYVIFSSISTTYAFPRVEVKKDKDIQFCEVFFPIINHNQSTASKNQLLRDIIFAFFYYYNVRIIIQKACLIVKEEDMSERDAILTVLLSPFLRFPGLAESKLDGQVKKTISCHSTKLNQKDQDHILTQFKKNFPGKNSDVIELKFYNEMKNFRNMIKDGANSSNQSNRKFSFSSVLLFDSKVRQMKALGFSNFPILDIIYRRLKIGSDIMKILSGILKKETEDSFYANQVISIVDIGQRNSIMDFSNHITYSFFYDGEPGSTLCSYRTIKNDKDDEIYILYLTFRTADPKSVLLNANAIAASIKISDIVIFPVSTPLSFFIQCFEYAISHNKNFELRTYPKSIYLQFPSSTPEEHAKYFTSLFLKTLRTSGFSKTDLNYFIGTKITEKFEEDSQKTTPPIKTPIKKVNKIKKKTPKKTTQRNSSDSDNDGSSDSSDSSDSSSGRTFMFEDSKKDKQKRQRKSRKDSDKPKKKKKKNLKKKPLSSQNKNDDDDDDDDDDDQNSQFSSQKSTDSNEEGKKDETSNEGNISHDVSKEDLYNESIKSINSDEKNLKMLISSDNSRNINDIINTITLFSIVNDYREYMDMNLFFLNEDTKKAYQSFIFDQNQIIIEEEEEERNE